MSKIDISQIAKAYEEAYYTVHPDEKAMIDFYKPINNFLTQLKKARKEKGLSKRMLSAITGISKKRISGIEEGAVDPSLDEITTLCRALGVKEIHIEL